MIARKELIAFIDHFYRYMFIHEYEGHDEAKVQNAYMKTSLDLDSVADEDLQYVKENFDFFNLSLLKLFKIVVRYRPDLRRVESPEHFSIILKEICIRNNIT